MDAIHTLNEALDRMNTTIDTAMTELHAAVQSHAAEKEAYEAAMRSAASRAHDLADRLVAANQAAIEVISASAYSAVASALSEETVFHTQTVKAVEPPAPLYASKIGSSAEPSIAQSDANALSPRPRTTSLPIFATVR